MAKRTLVMLGLAASIPAHADKARYTRNQDVRIDVKFSERVRPVAAHATPPAAPPITGEAVMSIEGLLGTFRAEQEAILLDLIKHTPDSEPDEKADYYFRLGELYAKEQRYWRLESAKLAIAADRAKTSAAKKQAQTDADAAAKQAKHFLAAAAGTYKELTSNNLYRNYPKMDVALFYFGYTLQHGNYLTEARAAYDKLLKEHPNSKYVPDAHLAFADYYFEQNQLANAEASYKRVLEFPKSPAFWYAKYKLGWIQLDKRTFQDALETFFEVAQATRGDEKAAILHRAALKDFVRAYAEVGKADKAYVAFRRLEPTDALAMLDTLADLYLEQGKSDKAIATYRELMRLAPTNKDVCLWQYDVAHAMLSLSGASTSDKVKEIEDLVRLYSAVNRKLPKVEATECRDNAAAMSGELARAYHSEFAKTQNPDLLGSAERLYKAYLDAFADAPDHADTQYYYAELLWSRAVVEPKPRTWEIAATAFADVVKRGKVAPRLLKEAAYAAVLGWKNALDIDPQVARRGDPVDDKDYDKVPEPQPIPPRETQMLAAFDLYVRTIKDPNDADRVGIQFMEANLFRRYNQLDKAIPLFEDIVTHHRDHETAEFAANLLLDSLNRKQEHAKMLALAKKLAADKQFLDGKEELAGRLAYLEIQAKRKAAEDLERQAKATGDFTKYVACGQAYIDIYNANPEAKDNDQVLYNALVCYHEGKSVGAAILAFNLLERYYATSKLMPRAVGRIGKAYGDVAFYEKAAEKLEQYAKRFAGEADAFSAMSGAVFYRKGIGQDDKAIDDTRFFIKTFGAKQPDEAANAMFSLATVYEKQGDATALVKHLREYIARFGARGGADRLVIAYAKIGQALWTQSCPVKQVDGSCIKIVRERAITKLTRRSDQPTQCGPASKSKLTVIARDPRKAKEAMAAFADAIREQERAGGKTGGDEAGARYYYAQSRLAIADRDFEAYLDLRFPQGLDFDPHSPAIAKKSLQRFDAWLADKTKAGTKAREQYESVLAVKDSATSIAAAARMGQLSQHFSDALFTAEIPKDVRSGPYADAKVEAFCDRMTEVAEPLEARSVEAYGVCLAKSTELGWFSDWSKLCERELGQIKPEQYPTASELRGTPNQLARVVAIEAPVVRLE